MGGVTGTGSLEEILTHRSRISPIHWVVWYYHLEEWIHSFWHICQPYLLTFRWYVNISHDKEQILQRTPQPNYESNIVCVGLYKIRDTHGHNHWTGGLVLLMERMEYTHCRGRFVDVRLTFLLRGFLSKSPYSLGRSRSSRPSEDVE